MVFDPSCQERILLLIKEGKNYGLIASVSQLIANNPWQVDFGRLIKKKKKHFFQNNVCFAIKGVRRTGFYDTNQPFHKLIGLFNFLFGNRFKLFFVHQRAHISVNLVKSLKSNRYVIYLIFRFFREIFCFRTYVKEKRKKTDRDFNKKSCYKYNKTYSLL